MKRFLQQNVAQWLESLIMVILQHCEQTKGQMTERGHGYLALRFSLVLYIEPKTSHATRMGFEPTRAKHNGLAVHRLNHSATSSVWLMVIGVRKIIVSHRDNGTRSKQARTVRPPKPSPLQLKHEKSLFHELEKIKFLSCFRSEEIHSR